MLKLMSWYLLSILLVVFLHEFIHYGIAFFLGCNPAIHFDTAGGTGNYNTKTAQFSQQNATKVLNKMHDLKPGIYYYGFPTCPWCQELLPIYQQTLKNNQTQSYAVNTQKRTFTKYQCRILEQMYAKWTKSDDLTVPFIVGTRKDGKVRVHVGTVTGHNAKKRKMTLKQKEMLYRQLNSLIKWQQKS